MFNHQEIYASFNQPQDLVLEFRMPHKRFKLYQKLKVLRGILVLASLGFIVFLLWELWQSFANNPKFSAMLGALDWNTVWHALTHSKKPFPFDFILALLMLPLHFWMKRCMSKSKLIFNQTHLVHQSGFPHWIGNLTKQNWGLLLEDFQSGKAKFTLAGQNWASNPLFTYALQWKSDDGFQNSKTMKRLNVAAWFLPGQSALEPIKLGSVWLSLNPWKTPEGQAILQNAFDRMPLIVALRERGVPVPAVGSAKRHNAGDGMDLFAYPRLKVAIFAFFGLMIAAGLGYHFMRHQHFFEPPSWWVWAACGAACASVVWMWLAQEQEAQEKSLTASQGLISVLIGIACALAAPSVLAAINTALYPAQITVAKLSHNPLNLQSLDASIPALYPATAHEFWNSLAQGSIRKITIRQGLFGTWQYDSEPLEQEVHQFYDKQPKRKRQ